MSSPRSAPTRARSTRRICFGAATAKTARSRTTVGNLSHLPDHVIELIRRALKGEEFASATDAIEIVRSVPHGDALAVSRAVERLHLRELLSSRPCREVDLVIAMIQARILAPQTKLATTRWWHQTTAAEDLGVAGADEDELYAAMDWLLERQPVIEKKLASRHLEKNGLVLYDLSSSYFEGSHCPLAKIGYSRDGKKNKLQVNYGLLTDERGCPVAISVYDGNVNDAATFMPQVRKLKDAFGIGTVVFVGDRGMISQKSIDQLRDETEMAWITSLRSAQIRALVEGGAIQLGLFDKRNIFELSHPEYPGERLVACRNEDLARLRAAKRQSLLDATVKELEQVVRMVERGKLKTAAEIGVRVGRVVNKYRVAKHFELEIRDGHFAFHRLEAEVAKEAALDGIYVVRTPLPKKEMSTADVVRNYKRLSYVERAFRSMKTMDLKVRPIHHRLADRVRSHIFLCMLAYYVEWHMREAWRPMLFADEDLEAKETRDPVAPAERSDTAQRKASSHALEDGTPAHSFHTLLRELSCIVRNTCKPQGNDAATFTAITTANPVQRRALELINSIKAA